MLHETINLLDKIFRVTFHAYVALGHIQREEKSFRTVKPQSPIPLLTLVGNPRQEIQGIGMTSVKSVEIACVFLMFALVICPTKSQFPGNDNETYGNLSTLKLFQIQ